MNYWKNFTKRKFEEDYLDLCLPFIFDLDYERLHFVNDLNALILFGTILEESNIIGLDTETKPVQHCSKKFKGIYKVSLLQIASRDCRGLEYVFILDLHMIMNNIELSTLFCDIISKAFCSPEITKIGHGIQNDIHELYQSYPAFKAFHIVNNILDTNVIHRYLQPSIKVDKSLKYFTKIYLNFNLIKSQQCSSWEKRPLTSSQLHYAACDALVLLRIYDAMCCESMDLFGTIDFTLYSTEFRIDKDVSMNSIQENQNVVFITKTSANDIILNVDDTNTHPIENSHRISEYNSQIYNSRLQCRYPLKKSRRLDMGKYSWRWKALHSQKTCSFHHFKCYSIHFLNNNAKKWRSKYLDNVNDDHDDMSFT